jgi:hypothetical protein
MAMTVTAIAPADVRIRTDRTGLIAEYRYFRSRCGGPTRRDWGGPSFPSRLLKSAGLRPS